MGKHDSKKSGGVSDSSIDNLIRLLPHHHPPPTNTGKSGGNWHAGGAQAMQQVQRELSRMPHRPLKRYVGWMRPNQPALDLKDELLQFAEYVSLRDCERDCRRRMLADLEEAVKIIFPRADVHTFGSYAAGLSIFQSDIDISIHTESNPIASPSKQHTYIDLTGTTSKEAPVITHVDLTVSDEDTDYEEKIVKGDKKTTCSTSSSSTFPVAHASNHSSSVAIVSALADSAGIGAGDDEQDISWSLDYSANEVGASSLGKRRRPRDDTSSGDDASDDEAYSNDEESLGSPPVLQFEFNTLKKGSAVAILGNRFPSSSSSSSIIGVSATSRRDEEAVKKKVLKSLRSTYDFVRTLHWARTIELRGRAKVPIINLTHRSGVECDISFGLAANDTTAVVQALRDKAGMDVFYPVSSFLKVFLAFLDLDKPFTGGLGSFKLYVMVAWIVETISSSKRYQLSKEQGGEEIDVGIVLFFFFKYFGNPDFLNINTKITTKSKVEITLAQTMQVVSIQRAFSRAYKVLEDHRSKGDSLSSELSPSQLGKLLDCEELNRTRSQALERCLAFPLLSGMERDIVASAILNALQQKAKQQQQQQHGVKSGNREKNPTPIDIARIKTSHPHFYARLRSFQSEGDFNQLSRQPAQDMRQEQRMRKDDGRGKHDGHYNKKRHKSTAYGLLGGVVGQSYLNGGKKKHR